MVLPVNKDGRSRFRDRLFDLMRQAPQDYGMIAAMLPEPAS